MYLLERMIREQLADLVKEEFCLLVLEISPLNAHKPDGGTAKGCFSPLGSSHGAQG